MNLCFKNLLLLFLIFPACANSEYEYIAENIYEDNLGGNPVILADPFIIYDNGKYYAYGTKNAHLGFNYYVSDDLYTWRYEKVLALNKDDVGGDTNFWAPEVFYIPWNNEFYIYYSSDYRIYVAVSDNPYGPFVDKLGRDPVVYNAIDGSVILDADGNNYIYYADHGWPHTIWVAQFDNQLNHVYNLKLCIDNNQEWEGKELVEGPTVFKWREWYIMTYSANRHTEKNYGVGYAFSKSPMGPWVKSNLNPFLSYPVVNGIELHGTGHNSVFTDRQGNLRIVFHAHGRSYATEPRVMCIGNLNVWEEDGIPMMSISDIFIPQVITD